MKSSRPPQNYRSSLQKRAALPASFTRVTFLVSVFTLYWKIGQLTKKKETAARALATTIMMSGKLWLISKLCSPEIGVKVYSSGCRPIGEVSLQAQVVLLANGERQELLGRRLPRPYKSSIIPQWPPTTAQHLLRNLSQGNHLSERSEIFSRKILTSNCVCPLFVGSSSLTSWRGTGNWKRTKKWTWRKRTPSLILNRRI